MNDAKAAGNSGGVAFRPFQIPLRSCRAKDADNLFMAGRCISGDFYAQASYRVTGSAVAQGEALGFRIHKEGWTGTITGEPIWEEMSGRGRLARGRWGRGRLARGLVIVAGRPEVGPYR